MVSALCFFSWFLFLNWSSRTRDTIATATVGRAITIWEAIYRKEAMNQSIKSIQKWSKEIKSNNFCYIKIRRAITKWGAIEKSSILLAQHWKIYHFDIVPKIILHFGETNNNFAGCSGVQSVGNVKSKLNHI